MMMPDNLPERVRWAMAVIAQDSEPDTIGTAAHVLLSALEMIEVQATHEITPGWVGIPTIEWESIMGSNVY